MYNNSKASYNFKPALNRISIAGTLTIKTASFIRAIEKQKFS
jgi:hypothetical protein